MRAIAKAALALPFAALLFSSGADARGPSFSCRANLNLPERIICYDPELSRLDRRLNELYRGAGGSQDASPEVRAYIKDALLRRNHCATSRCIRRILVDEIDYLERHQDDDGGY